MNKNTTDMFLNTKREKVKILKGIFKRRKNLFAHSLRNGEIPILPHMNSTLSMEQFYTEPFLHTNPFMHRSICTQTNFTDAVASRHFCTQMLGHIKVFTCILFYTHGLVQRKGLIFDFQNRNFYSQDLFLAQTMLHTHTVSHRNIFCWFSFAHRTINTQGCFQRSFDTQTFFLYTRFCATFSTQKAHKQFDTETFSHRRFYQKNFRTLILLPTNNPLHTKTVSLLDAFCDGQIFIHTDPFTHRRDHRRLCILTVWHTESVLHMETLRRSPGIVGVRCYQVQ